MLLLVCPAPESKCQENAIKSVLGGLHGCIMSLWDIESDKSRYYAVIRSISTTYKLLHIWCCYLSKPVRRFAITIAS